MTFVQDCSYIGFCGRDNGNLYTMHTLITKSYYHTRLQVFNLANSIPVLREQI